LDPASRFWDAAPRTPVGPRTRGRERGQDGARVPPPCVRGRLRILRPESRTALRSSFLLLLLSIGRLCSDPECLTYGREQRKPEHPEELEVDPELFAEIVDDVQVGGAEEREVRNPDVVQLSPERGVELDGVPEHPLREVLLSTEVADEAGGGEQPVHDGRFPLKKQRITESDRDRPQDDDQGGRDQQQVA